MSEASGHAAGRAALARLQHALEALADGGAGVAPFASAWRAEEPLLAMLPPAYRRVRDDLLQRLESGSLFDEESCSFSRTDLHEAFAAWLSKAGARLDEQAGR